MRFILSLFILLYTIPLFAQDNAAGQKEIWEAITEPEALDWFMADTATVNGEYPEKIYRRLGKTHIIDANYRHNRQPCGENAGLARRVSPDSFVCFYTDFNSISSVDTLQLSRTQKGLLIHGQISCYGSGGGTYNNGLMVVSLSPVPILLFQLFYSCSSEAFPINISEEEAKAQTYDYTRKVTVKGSSIVIAPNYPQLSRIHKLQGTCDISPIATGTYVYRNGRFSRVKAAHK